MNVLTDFAEYIYREINHTNSEISPEILDWKPVQESNSIRWILTHQTRIAYILIPQVITETYNPAGWDDHYEKDPHTLEELLRDLKAGKENALSLLSKLTEADLNKEIMIWGKMRPKKEPIFALLGELMHHNGQIAMLKGIRKRRG
jgi:uncharacterized damage-inducible protein DinB